MEASSSNVFNSAGSVTASGNAKVHIGDSHHHHTHRHGEDAAAKREQMRIDFLQRLRACPYEERKDRNPTRAEGTCEWFVRHRLFEHWQAQQSALLWVTADPGCGKSVLARYLVDEVLPTNDDRLTCYFFFKDDFDDQSVLSIAICAILHQLFRQEPDLLSDEYLTRFREDGEFLLRSSKGLFGLLRDVAGRCSRKVVCVLDALDECSEPTSLVDALTDLYADQSGYKRVNFIITSRPYRSLRANFATLEETRPTIRLSGENEEEVKQIEKEVIVVIRQRIAQLARLRFLTASQAEALEAALTMAPNRTYLWIHLVFAHLDDANLTKQSALTEAIETLPLTVDEAYDRILSKSGDAQQVLKILQLIVAAKRPFDLREMALALAFDNSRYRTYSDIDDDASTPAQLQQELRDLCGLFVVIDGGRLFLLHQTAREFLTQQARSHSKRLRWRHSINLNNAHAVLASLCMRFLFIMQFANTDLSKDAYAKKACHDFVLLDYAANHWPEHYRNIETKDATEFDSIAYQLCSDKIFWLDVYTLARGDSWLERYPMCVAGYLGLHKLIDTILLSCPPQKSLSSWWIHGSALQIASTYGHASFVDALLKTKPWRKLNSIRPRANRWHRDQVREAKGKALICAANQGHYTIVETLLQAGAEADYQNADTYKASPLKTAALRGADDIVKLLIQHGARDGIGADHLTQNGATCFNALTEAAHHGDCAQVMLLLSGAQLVDAVDAAGNTALIRATKQGHCDVVKLLLENDANVDAFGLDGSTALCCAVNAGNQEVIRLLLASNASIGGGSGSSLARAIFLGKEDIVEMLLSLSAKSEDFKQHRDIGFWKVRTAEMAKQFLEHGTSPNLRNGKGTTALSHFVSRDKADIVELLLSHGAKVHERDEIMTFWDYSISRYRDVRDGSPILAGATQSPASLKLLLDHGANIEDHDGEGLTPLALAARLGCGGAVELLLEHNAQVEARDKLGRTPLHYAVYAAVHIQLHKPTQVLEMLLDSGAPIEAADNTGHTALSYAAQKCWGELAIKVLLAHGARIDTRDEKGRTPLMEAAERADIDVIQMLLNNGAQVDAADSGGRTALWRADKNRDVQVVRLLKAAGARESISLRTRLGLLLDRKC
ncbi:ankyrin repeat domain-containing protein 50 [Microdochium nivale]|nr:ankyrin repeat domain-containing protein 50 [Microdochium nivale]